jgi:hypothetical protein
VKELEPTAAELLKSVLIASTAVLSRKPFRESLSNILRKTVQSRAKSCVDVGLTMEATMAWQQQLKNLRQLEWGVASTEPVQLADWLYLGGAEGWTAAWLAECNVTHVVNMAAKDVRYMLPSSVKTLCVAADDNDSYDLFAHWPDVFSFISSAVTGSVFIHCVAGINRSASFAVAAVCLIERRSFLSVFREVLRRRPGILSNLHFQCQLLHCVHKEGLLLEDAAITAEIDAHGRRMQDVFELFAEDGIATFECFCKVMGGIHEDSNAQQHWDRMGMYTLARRDMACIELWFRSDVGAAGLYKRLSDLAQDASATKNHAV